MIPSSFVQLVKKYAVIIILFSFLQIAFSISLPMVVATYSYGSAVYEGLMQTASWTPSYLLNIITAILVYLDMKKSGHFSVSVILVTLLMGEYGIALFLLLELYHAFTHQQPVASVKTENQRPS